VSIIKNIHIFLLGSFPQYPHWPSRIIHIVDKNLENSPKIRPKPINKINYDIGRGKGRGKLP